MTRPVERLEEMVARLKARGCRLTPQRLAILKVLARSQGHPTVEQVHRRLLGTYPTLSLATVYKTIALLKEEGQVLEIAFSGFSNRYDGHRPSPHPHVICAACGEIRDANSLDLAALVELAAKETGYRIISHRLDFYGLCPRCQAEAE